MTHKVICLMLVIAGVIDGFQFPLEAWPESDLKSDRIGDAAKWKNIWITEPKQDAAKRAYNKCMTPTRKHGSCLSIYDCNSILSFFGHRLLSWEEREFLRLSACSGAPSGRSPFVCCPDKVTKLPGVPAHPSTTHQPPAVEITSTSPPAQTTHEPPVVNIPSTNPPLEPKNRAEISGGVLPDPKKNECGVSIGMRIYGGENADIDEFPWLALLEFENFRGERKFSCGGSLINSRYVITAAHCVIGEVQHKEGELVSVRLGEYDTTTEIDCIEQDNERICADPPLDVPIEEKLPHPEYNETTKLNDIALLRLNRDIRYSDFVQPICLPHAEFKQSAAGDIAFVTGFGRTLKGSRSSIKQKLGIKVYDQQRCQAKFATKKADITPKQLCAGGDFARDSCHGDSGGPLMKLHKVWTLEGVVSYGNRCGLEDWPGVYTRVPAYVEWVQATIRN